jgi:hypothetical protein
MECLSKRTKQLAMVSAHVQLTSGANSFNCYSGIRVERSLFMSKERGEELFRALNVILDAVFSLNLRDLEAKAKANRGESSSKAAAESSK